MSSLEQVRPSLSDRLRRRTTGGVYVPEIDGLRFLAIAPVVLQHLAERLYRGLELRGALTEFDLQVASLVPTGILGVQLFFVISGYIICLPLAKRASVAPQRSPEFSYGRYMLRRLTRLEPPYLLALGLSFAAVLMIHATDLSFLTSGTRSFSADSISLPASFAASAVYAHGLLFQSPPRLNPPAWSLEIEFQFYIIAPAIILFSLAVGRWLSSFVAEVLVMIAIVFTMKLAAIMLAPSELQPYLVSHYVEFFVLGFVLSRLYSRGVFENPRLQAVASPLFLGGVALMLYADHYRSVSAMVTTRTQLIAGCAAIFVGTLSGGVGRRFTSATWIATIGGMCYTIYLIQLMLFQVGTRLLFRVIPIHDLLSGILIYGVVLIPLLFVASAVFFTLVEKPCMDPQWPQKLYQAARRLFNGNQRQPDNRQESDSSSPPT